MMDMAWQKITRDTKKVERCLLWCPEKRWDGPIGCVFGSIRNGIAYGDGMTGRWEFTHWMPLPEPPKVAP